MNTQSIQIRRLLPADAALYREIRLEALRVSPEAFGSAYETESAYPVEWFADRLTRGAVILGAFRGDEIAGIVGFVTAEGPKQRHKGELVSMYVRPAARRGGVGRLLVEAALELAAETVERVLIAVVKGNEQAHRLYRSAGFVEYGLEQRALKIEGRYYDDILMAKDLVARVTRPDDDA
ncbi:GNAT family N-acetyltransferase [Bradyrhizobium sp. USDA 4454]